MASRPDIKPQMQVMTSDRAFLGTVDGFEGDDLRVKLTRAGEGHQTIPAAWIERVDEHVHLNRSGPEIEVGVKAAQFSNKDKPAQATPTPAARAGNKQIWIWAIAAVVVLLLLMMLF